MREHGASAGRVLVVAGTRVARTLVGGQLRPRGFEVEEAMDAAGALRAAQESPPDVVLLDDDGFDLLERLKATPRSPTSRSSSSPTARGPTRSPRASGAARTTTCASPSRRPSWSRA
jgi:CheY-like chemotaxis protein